MWLGKIKHYNYDTGTRVGTYNNCIYIFSLYIAGSSAPTAKNSSKNYKIQKYNKNNKTKILEETPEYLKRDKKIIQILDYQLLV